MNNNFKLHLLILIWLLLSSFLAWAEKPFNTIQVTLKPGLVEEIRRMDEFERLKAEHGIQIGDQFANLFFEGVATGFSQEDSAAWARIGPLVDASDEEWQELSSLRYPAKIGGVELDIHSRGTLLVCPQITLSSIESVAGQLTLTYHATIMGGLSFPSQDIDDAFHPDATKQTYKLILYLNEHSRVTKFTAQNDEIADVYLRWIEVFKENLQNSDPHRGQGETDIDVRSLIKHRQDLVRKIEQQAAQVCK